MGFFFSAELPKWMRIRRRLEMIYAGRLGDDWEYDFGVSYKMVPQWAVKTLSWCVYNSNFTSWFMVDIENTTIPTYGFCSPTFNHITNTGGTSARIRIIFGKSWDPRDFGSLGMMTMGDLQDPTDGGTCYVPYIKPYELWWYSLKFRP